MRLPENVDTGENFGCWPSAIKVFHRTLPALLCFLSIFSFCDHYLCCFPLQICKYEYGIMLLHERACTLENKVWSLLLQVDGTFAHISSPPSSHRAPCCANCSTQHTHTEHAQHKHTNTHTYTTHPAHTHNTPTWHTYTYNTQDTHTHVHSTHT
jgi:hypothetical protein